MACNNHEEGAEFPTTESIHKKIQEIPGMPKWSKTTTFRILTALGFRLVNEKHAVLPTTYITVLLMVSGGLRITRSILDF